MFESMEGSTMNGNAWSVRAFDGRSSFVTVETCPNAWSAFVDATKLVAAGFYVQIAKGSEVIADRRDAGRTRGWQGRDEDWKVIA